MVTSSFLPVAAFKMPKLRMHSMLIEGEEEVKAHLRQMIQTMEKELFECIERIERAFSTRILSEIFDIIPRRVRQSRNEVEKQRRLRDPHDTVMVLDTLIENNKLNPFCKLS